MSNSFIPRAYQEQPQVDTTPVMPTPPPKVMAKSDSVGALLMKVGQYILIGLAFLTPLAFTPGLKATLGFDKAILALAAGLAILVLTSLASLRFKNVKTVVPLPLLLFWLLVVAMFVSGFLSGDSSDAIRGSFFETQTAGFFAILALVMTVPLILQRSKIMSLNFILAFAGSIAVLAIYNIIRFLAGPVLPFGSFLGVTSSPAGGLNDLAVFSGITVVIGLITVAQLPLKKWMQWSVVGLVTVSLFVLMVANFFHLWIIVGFFALLFLIYILSKDTLFSSDETDSETTVSPLLIAATALVCVVSALFVVAGDYAGAKVAQITNVNYIEVRPSVGATVDMVKSVYQEDILLGSGPNRFGDVWRIHKDRSINETNFWNVDFVAGFGLVPTLFVTLGLLGGVLLFAFHISYLYLGYKMLLRTESTDSFWYYVGTVSFVASAVLWAIAYIYVPGAAVLLATVLFTGLSFVAYQALVPAAEYTLPLASNKRRGMLLIGITVVLVVVSVSTIFSVGKQYAAQRTFTNASITATSVEEFEGGVQEAYGLYADKRFLDSLNQLKINQLQQLLVVEEPSEEEQQRFVSLAEQAISLAQESISRDNTSPVPYAALADIYNILDRAGLEGARDRAFESLDEAQKRDPLDPGYSLARAFISAQSGAYDEAKSFVSDALQLKNNYTEALFLLAQISIQEGDVAAAVETAKQVVTFEPNNPTRYYQLGILLAANNELDQAVIAYQAALTRDPNYANARYMLGLAYTAQGNTTGALQELRKVQETNGENTELQAIIAELEGTGTISNLNLGLTTPVNEANPAATTEDGVVASSTPNTNLVTPVNTEASQSAPVTNAPDSIEGQ